MTDSESPEPFSLLQITDPIWMPDLMSAHHPSNSSHMDTHPAFQIGKEKCCKTCICANFFLTNVFLNMLMIMITVDEASSSTLGPVQDPFHP
jgi:hypothetical protein